MIIKNCFYLIKAKKNIFLLLSILSIALFFRIIGFNWDQGQHLHPDERFLTMVLTTIKIPTSFSQYLNPQISTLNPYNNDFSFFVYGAFPLNLVKITGEFLNKTTYDQIHFIGRALTILADVLIVLLIYLISQIIFNQKIALLSSFFYSVCVLPIQLSHFYTVDPFLNLFIVLSFYFLILIKNKKNIFTKVFLLSLSFGIALACKISGIYFLPIIAIFFLFNFYKKPNFLFFYTLIFLLLTAIFFRFNQPQAFSSGNFLDWNLNPQFISNIKELQSYDKISYYPPGIQWLKTTPIIFPLKNIVLWGAGLPLGIIFILSCFYSIYFIFKKGFSNNISLFIIIFWILLLFFYQGIQHVTTMRYFLPVYPFLCIISAFFINQIFLFNIKIFKLNFIKLLFFIVLLIYPISFLSIYLKDHTRVAASKWIYQNIPIGLTLATEYWDDPLPLFLEKKSLYDYQYQSLNVASPDSQEKISIIKDQLNKSDYIILTSNRFYLPIPQNPEIYPLTTNYYKSLFDGSLGFQKVAEFTSYPVFNDTFAEEAFTVYDHPKVLIFQKTSNFNLNSF
jgi:hypothetical protein